MTLPALADIDGIKARLGVTTIDETRAQALLDDASAIIRDEAGKDWVTDGDLSEDLPPIVVTICYAVAIRAFRNPEGLRSETVGGEARAYFSSDVFLTDAEAATIRKAAGKSMIGSITLTSPYPPPLCDTVYVPVEGGGDDFPMYVEDDFL